MPKKVKPAPKQNKDAFRYVLIFATFSSFVIISFNTAIFIHSRVATKVLGAQTEDLITTEELLLGEKGFWEQIIKKHSTYRDAYIELADIENKLGNLRRSEELLNLARGVDPNY